jgi:uncharacterized protein YjbI with pentapeptide repeats
MHIIKSLQASLLTNTFQYNRKHFFVASTLWPFELDLGAPILEQDFWGAVGEQLGPNALLDEAMNKGCAEYLVFGDAIAPNNAKVDRLDVQVDFAGTSKRLNVYGDRYWKGAGPMAHASDPIPFERMPLNYSYAFGGPEHDFNKDGRGCGEIELHEASLTWLANIEDPNRPVTSKSTEYQPVGFGPIPLDWPTRQALVGTYDDHYLKNHMPGLAPDIDWSYFNVSPLDQRFAEIFQGNETFAIHNMHDTKAIIKGQLPSVRGRCFVHQKTSLEAMQLDPEADPRLEFEKHKFRDDPDGVFKEIALKLDTVLFFPNANLGVVVHRGSCEVMHPQGLDIAGLMVAHQGVSDPSKDISYYQNEFVQRTDPQDGFKYLLNTSPLIPSSIACGFKQMLESIDDKSSGQESMEQYVEGQKKVAEDKQEEVATQQIAELESAGKEEEVAKLKEALSRDNSTFEIPEDAKKIKAIADKILPGAADGDVNFKNLDLSQLNLKAMDELGDEMDKQAKNKKQEAIASIKEQIAELKKFVAYTPGGRESIEKLEKMLEDIELPPILPRPDFSEMEKLQAHVAQAQQMLQETKDHEKSGLPMALTPEQIERANEVDKHIADLDLAGIIEENKQHIENSYRVGAHFIEEARSPHPGQEQKLAIQFLQAYADQSELIRQDIAYCQFSSQQFSQFNMSDTFAEYSHWQDIQFSDCVMAGVILAHATIKGCQFTNSDLSGINLGSGHFEDCWFKDVNIQEATFARSKFSRCRFENCQFDDRMDAWLEVHMDSCVFINCQLTNINFIELEMPRTRFENCDLSESNFVKPDLTQAQFIKCKLHTTNFVVGMLSRVSFIESDLNNTRFVGGCNLSGAKFNNSKIHMTNLRDCQLQQSDFSGADLSGSDLGSACLSHSNLQRCKAHKTQFIDCQMNHCNFIEADMMEANMMQANLKSSKFNDANLYSVSFLNATIGNTDFSRAILKNTILQDWRPVFE